PDARAVKILVVDDQPDLRFLFRVNLALEGYAVVEAADGISAVSAIRRETPDLMLLDVMMPRLDGWGVLDALRDDGRLDAPPVVLVSALVQPEDQIRAWLAGIAEYLAKPFSPSSLLDVVAQTLLRTDHAERRRRALANLGVSHPDADGARPHAAR
ncbi:MAG TPA: response regulator, partial [Actinomycetota bacterium]|nr:response regulator [Actinomycetota bacterium]